MSKTKLRDNKITASRQLAAVPSGSCRNFIISVSQAAAHWLQLCLATKYLGFWYSKIRILSTCVKALQPTYRGFIHVKLRNHKHKIE
jgi:hypothetical protein